MSSGHEPSLSQVKRAVIAIKSIDLKGLVYWDDLASLVAARVGCSVSSYNESIRGEWALLKMDYFNTLREFTEFHDSYPAIVDFAFNTMKQPERLDVIVESLEAIVKKQKKDSLLEI